MSVAYLNFKRILLTFEALLIAAISCGRPNKWRFIRSSLYIYGFVKKKHRSINLMVSYHSLSTANFNFILFYFILQEQVSFAFCFLFLLKYIICTRENEKAVIINLFLSFLWLEKKMFNMFCYRISIDLTFCPKFNCISSFFSFVCLFVIFALKLNKLYLILGFNIT